MQFAFKGCKTYAFFAAILVILFSILQLVGISLKWEAANRFLWGETICVFKSISMLLLGIAFFLKADKKNGVSLVRETFALASFFISVIAFIAYFNGWPTDSIWSIGRLAIPTALMILFAALGVFIQAHSKLFILSQAFFITSFFIAFSALVGFFLGFYNYHFYTDSPLSTLISSIGWMLLSSAFLLKTPEKGVTGLLINPSMGGKVFRVMLLFAVGIPILLSWIMLFIEVELHLPPTAAIQLLAFLTLIAFVFIVWSTSFWIYKLDSERVRGKQILETFLTILEKFENTPDLEKPITSSILQSITQTLEGDVGELWIYNPHNQTISCKMIWPANKEIEDATFPLAFRPGEGAPGLVFQKKVMFSFHKVMKEPFAARYEIARKLNINHIIGFPLLSQNEPLGVILLSKFGDLPFPKESENIAPSVGVLIGHTIALKYRQIELEKKTKLLEEANKELEQFNYVVSHDLQEPLRKVVTFSTLIKKNSHDLPAETQEHIERIVLAAKRMSQFITSLLELSRTSKNPLKRELIDLNKVIANVINELEIKIHELGATINYESLPSLWADPVQMYQLFLNLITNALKFHNENQPPVITLQGDVKNQTVYIAVKDNGKGVPPEYKEKIFSPFFYHHTAPDHEGTGIGLAICRKIIERHGGCIYVESDLSNGATFFIELPLEKTKGVA